MCMKVWLEYPLRLGPGFSIGRDQERANGEFSIQCCSME